MSLEDIPCDLPWEIERIRQEEDLWKHGMYIPLTNLSFRKLFLLRLYPQITHSQHKLIHTQLPCTFQGKEGVILGMGAPLYRVLWECHEKQSVCPILTHHLEYACCYLIYVP